MLGNAMTAPNDNGLNTTLPTPLCQNSRMTTKRTRVSEEPIDLAEHPFYVDVQDNDFNVLCHRVVTISHKSKWFIGNNQTITGDVSREPTSEHQWSHKGPSGERISPDNPHHKDMLPLYTFLHMMPPKQLQLMLQLANERLAANNEQELTMQELLRWIGVCVLISTTNFCRPC